MTDEEVVLSVPTTPQVLALAKQATVAAVAGGLEPGGPVHPLPERDRRHHRGGPSCTQVPDRTHRRLRDGYRFERPGPIEVKGKGKMVTWFLVGRTQ
jgi:hypothetical protein